MFPNDLDISDISAGCPPLQSSILGKCAAWEGPLKLWVSSQVLTVLSARRGQIILINLEERERERMCVGSGHHLAWLIISSLSPGSLRSLTSPSLQSASPIVSILRPAFYPGWRFVMRGLDWQSVPTILWCPTLIFCWSVVKVTLVNWQEFFRNSLQFLTRPGEMDWTDSCERYRATVLSKYKLPIWGRLPAVVRYLFWI